MTDDRGALVRGLNVLKRLAAEPGLTLEQLVRKTGYPKTSLFRILQALTGEQMITRDRRGSYHPRVRLQFLSDPSFEDVLRQAMQSLAATTGQTVEWYQTQKEGMRLLVRELPCDTEIGVQARVGFIRPWNEELDAVLCVGLAFLKPLTLVVDTSRFEGYQQPFVRSCIPAETAQARIAAAAATGVCRDDIANSNNVRRVAELVRHRDRPFGVLAVAEVVHPALPGRIQDLEKQLIQAVEAFGGAFPVNAPSACPKNRRL